MATNTKEFRVKNGLEISSGPIKINGSSGSSGQVLSSTGSGVQWVAPTTGSGTGDVVGPASSTINAVVRFDGTTGKLIKNSSGVTIDDSSNITTSGSLTVSGNATFDTNTLFVDATNDRVGIGTVSPSGKLDVRGVATVAPSATLTAGDLVVDTSARTVYIGRLSDTGLDNTTFIIRNRLGAEAMHFDGGANGYTYISSPYNYLSFGTGGGSGIERLRIDASGNVGISTVSPAYKLDVNGTLNASGAITQNGSQVLTAGNYNSYALPLSGGTLTGSVEVTSGQNVRFGHANQTDSNDGKIGASLFASGLNIVGTQTVSGGGRIIRLWGSVQTDSSQLYLHSGNYNSYALPLSGGTISGALNINATTKIVGGSSLYFNLDSGSTSHGQMFDDGNFHIHSINSSPMWINSPNGTGVYINNQATGNVILTSSGSVGVGTAGPSAKLDVVGTSFFLRPNSVNAVGHFDVRNDTASPVSVRLAFGTDNTGWQMRFAKNYQGTYTDYMTITDGGNVGISNTAPSQKLDINGNIRLYGSSNNVYLLLRNNHQSIWGVRVLCWDYGDGQGINFETSDNTDTWGTRMVVRHNGNVGISTTAPAYKLDINGTARTTGRFYSNEWIQFDNLSALYSPHNGAHFLPNGSSYGSWKIEGQRNGWCGLEFGTTSNGNVSLMIRPDAGAVGFHNNSVGWQFRWSNGTAYCNKGTYGAGTEAVVLDSSNYSSYALPLSGGTISGSIYATSNNSGGEFYSYGWFRNYNSGTGIYNQATGNHFYSDGGYWNVAYGGTQGIRFRNGHAGAILGYLYAETSGYFGLLTNQGNWSVLSRPNGGGIILYGTSVDVAQTLYVHEADNKTRVPRTFVQSSTPTGTITNGDVWLQY